MKRAYTLKNLLPVMLSPVLFLPLQLTAQEQTNRSMVCVQGSAQAEVESGNIKTALLNGGDMFWNLSAKKFEVPKGSGKHSIFAGAVWFGGVDQNSGLNAAVQTYRQGGDQGFWPGPLDANASIVDATCGSFDFIAKTTSQEINSFRAMVATSSLPIDETLIPQSIKDWPGKGNPFRSNISFLGIQLAPFVDALPDGIYDPRQGDYPLILGDQAVYTIMNDVAGVKQPYSPITGLELHIMMYGFDNPANPSVNNTMFARYTFINRGTRTLNDTYFGKWVDFDLGNYQDDYIACDISRNMYYAYNGDNNDEGPAGYGQDPPAQGVVFLSHPMTNFVYYEDTPSSINGFPQVDTHYYNYMRSKWPNGNSITEGGQGLGGTTFTNYMYSGDPVADTGWTEASVNNPPGDRRGIGSHGPFTFVPGEIKVIDVAYPWARGNSYLNSITALKQAADNVQAFYNNVISARPEALQKAEQLKVYPNPTIEAAEVILPGNRAGKASVIIRDITGRAVWQSTMNFDAGQPQKITTTDLPTGMYLLQVQQGELTFFAKLIKQ